jgi:hypothetical protein
MGDIAVTKVAVEPVWYLPGVAERFNIGEYDIYRRQVSTDYQHRRRNIEANAV